MARKTPPVAKQVVDPKLESNAYLKARLIDFDTGSAQLEQQHMEWLAEKIRIAGTNSMYRVRLVGYASKVGDHKLNERLSNARMNSVLKYLQAIDDRVLGRIETWRAVGEDGYQAAESDNSADWRAVEVHIFIGDIPPPPPPPNVKPAPKPVEPLPGGKRSSKWAIASPGGAVSNILPGVVIGFNIFMIRNEETQELRGYISPVAGVGLSVSIPGLKQAGKALWSAITAPSVTNLDFTPKTTKYPVTWEEVESCMVTVMALGTQAPGIPVGFQASRSSFDCPSVWHYGPSGTPLRTGENLFVLESAGRDFQFGAGGSATTGPLVRVDN